MTNNDFVSDALFLIGALAQGADVSPEDATVALRVCDDIAAEWNDVGVSVNWRERTETTAECPLYGVEATAMKYELALRLCPMFGREPPPALLAMNGRAYSRLLRTQLTRDLEPVDPSMPESESVRQWFDITSG